MRSATSLLFASSAIPSAMPQEMHVSPPSVIVRIWSLDPAAVRRVDGRHGHDGGRRRVEREHADAVAVAEVIDRSGGGGDGIRQAIALHRAGAVDDDREVMRGSPRGRSAVRADLEHQERLLRGALRDTGLSEPTLQGQRRPRRERLRLAFRALRAWLRLRRSFRARSFGWLRRLSGVGRRGTPTRP